MVYLRAAQLPIPFFHSLYAFCKCSASQMPSALAITHPLSPAVCSMYPSAMLLVCLHNSTIFHLLEPFFFLSGISFPQPYVPCSVGETTFMAGSTSNSHVLPPATPQQPSPWPHDGLHAWEQYSSLHITQNKPCEL